VFRVIWGCVGERVLARRFCIILQGDIGSLGLQGVTRDASTFCAEFDWMSARTDIKGWDVIFGNARKEFVRICVQKFSYKEVDNINDANWVDAIIEACCGAFRAKPYLVTLYVSDFRPFLDAVLKLAHKGYGLARLEFLEPWIVVELGRSNTDELRANINLFDELGGDNELHCSVPMSTSDLEELIVQVQAIVNKFDPDARMGGPST